MEGGSERKEEEETISVSLPVCLQISISCAYWLVNRTGLPLVFRQEGVREEAAGQWEENEKASTSSPLLYAYQEGDTVEK